MGELEFGYNSESVREFLPQHGGVDWHRAWLAKHGGEDVYSVWAETIDEFGEFCEQMNQTNCAFYLNDTDPDFDCLVVVDHRDDSGDWWLPRYQLGERFDELYERIKDEVLVVKARYPCKQAVDYVLMVMGLDMPDEV